MAKTGDYPIPFDEDGNQLHYASDYHWKPSVMLPNDEFDDVLTYEGFQRGRSAAYLRFTRSSGKAVTMFLKEFDSIVPLLVGGKVAGRFRFIKRGQNYGAIRVGDGDA